MKMSKETKQACWEIISVVVGAALLKFGTGSWAVFFGVIELMHLLLHRFDCIEKSLYKKTDT